MAMTYSDHICANFEPTNGELYERELREHLKSHLDNAQAEIERLNGFVEGLESSKAYQNLMTSLRAVNQINQELENKITGYRRALESIVENPTHTSSGYSNLDNWVSWAKRHAREALK